jgi:hypothetical protein
MNKTKIKEAVEELQKQLNLAGANPKLKEDGGLGVLTIGAYENSKKPKLTIPTGDFFGAPWMAFDNDLLGKSETDMEMNLRFVPGWKLSGIPQYNTLVGSKHAWCIMRTNLHLHKAGLKGTGSAGARSLSSFGKKCPYWFGAQLPIKHKSGGRHAAEFLYWIDEAKQIAATRDGNRSNKFAVFATDLSGKGDTLVSGPRWPLNHPDGQFVSKAEVLKKYSFFKVTGTGSSTR